MAYNINKLKAKIVENGLTVRKLAPMLGISEDAMYEKINNKTEFKRSEIEAICKILKITDVASYFFDI